MFFVCVHTIFEHSILSYLMVGNETGEEVEAAVGSSCTVMHVGKKWSQFQGHIKNLTQVRESSGQELHPYESVITDPRSYLDTL